MVSQSESGEKSNKGVLRHPFFYPSSLKGRG